MMRRIACIQRPRLSSGRDKGATEKPLLRNGFSRAARRRKATHCNRLSGSAPVSSLVKRSNAPFEWQRNEITSVAFDAAGRVLAGGGVNGTINVWDAATGELVQTLPSQGGSITSLAFHPAQNVLASGSVNGTLLSVNYLTLLDRFLSDAV
jgi:WD40 repeat protein